MKSVLKADKQAQKDQQNSQFHKNGLYVREDDQDWGSAGMNDIQQEQDTNQ